MNTQRASLLSRRPSQLAAAADVDVTPVMNMFIILIPFLVSMAVFTQLASHAFTLPASDGAGEAITAAELPVTVALGTRAIVVARGDRELARVAAGDFDGLASELATLRGGADDVVVAVEGPVVCADVVRCLDRCREVGFANVGLAEGTGEVTR